METERPVAPLFPDKKPEPVDFRENKLALWRSPEAPPPIGAALENLGNTCFLNAVLQCVAHTVPLLQSLQSPPHPYPCAGDRGTFSGEEPSFCSLCALRQHIDVCMHEDANVVKPCGFVNNLSNISSSFSRYQQEDAHEFLHCLLDHLHTSCLDPPPGDSASLLQKTSLIKSTFGGRLKSQVQCCDCGHRSDTYEPLLDLSLEIEDAGSLEEALESFTKVEKIEDPEIKLTCEGCGGRVSVEKQFTLEQVPPVIALHLKRFKSNGYFADKIDKFVKYPTELDLRPFHSNPKAEGELRYDLYAAVMHQGCSSLYGHYYCFIRPSPDSWFIMDDEKVYRVNEENALTQNAYILFYMKRGTPWFSCFVEAGRMGGGGGCPDVGNRTSPVSVVDHVEADQSSSSSDSEDQGEASGADVERHANGSDALPEATAGSWACGGANDEARRQSSSPSDCLRSDSSPTHCEGSDCLPENEDEEKVDGNGGCRVSPPCTPRQSPKDKFFDEPWEDGKEQPAKAQSESKAERSTGREMVAVGSYLRLMPRSRRLRLEQLMGRAPSSSAPHEQKRKKPKLLQLHAEGSPPLPSSLLHKLIHAQEDASDLVISIDSAVRGEMTH